MHILLLCFVKLHLSVSLLIIIGNVNNNYIEILSYWINFFIYVQYRIKYI